jgi:hypothetical protein
MNAPVPETVLSTLGYLKRELQGELSELEKRSGPEGEQQALDEEIEAKRRELELVKATERQLAGQRQG